MSQPVTSSPSSAFRPTRPIAAKSGIGSGAISFNHPDTPRTMAASGPVTPSNGTNIGASASAPATTEAARPQYTFQFSAATEMILKRLRGEGGPLNPTAALGMRPGATTGAVQPPGYEDVRRSVLQGMKTTMNMDMPPATAKKNPKIAAVVKTAPQASVEASASPTSGTGLGKIKAAPKGGKSKAGTKRKRAKDDSDSEDDSAGLSGLDGDSDSDGHGSVTNMPKQTLSGRKVVKPAQFNPAAVEGSTRKRGPHSYKKSVRNVEQALCKRCGRGHSPASNMIVFCDGCNIGWHQMCHDPTISDDLVKDESIEWFCNECGAKRAKTAAPIPETLSNAEWSAKSMDEKRSYLSSFSHAHVVSLLLQATLIHPDIPIFPESARIIPPILPRPNERRRDVPPPQPFPPSATSTSGLFTRADTNPSAPINFIRKIQPVQFVTSFEHHSKSEIPHPTSHISSSAPPPLPTSQTSQSNPPGDGVGEDESRASTPASPPYPRPGTGLMAKLPPDDQDLEWLVGEGEDEAAFSHVVFDAEGSAQKVDGRGLGIVGQG